MSGAAARLGTAVATRALAVGGVAVVGVGLDAALLLTRAGGLLAAWQVAALLAAAAAAAALLWWRPTWWTLAGPLLGFALFDRVVADRVTIPDDAVLRDGQAGLAVAVMVGGQLLFLLLAYPAILSIRAGRRVDPPGPR